MQRSTQERIRNLKIGTIFGLISALFAACAIWLLTIDLGQAARAELSMQLANVGPLLGVLLVLLIGALAGLCHQWLTAPLGHVSKLIEEAQVLATTDVVRPLPEAGTAPGAALAKLLNTLVSQRENLRHDMNEQIAAASQRVEHEKNRLAALMSELTQSVVVCNLDGRILLYNPRAKFQFRAFADRHALAGGNEIIGLGRSIFGVLDKRLIDHGLADIGTRLTKGAANPTSQFVTTSPSGQLFNVQLAGVSEQREGRSVLQGFVLMLDNITQSFEAQSRQDEQLLALSEGSRAGLASIAAALDMLEFPDLEQADRERFLGVIRDEAQRMRERIERIGRDTAQNLVSRWPMQEMLGMDLLVAAQKRIESDGRITVTLGQIEARAWLKIDSFALMQALNYLAHRLNDEFEVAQIELRLTAADDGKRAHLDLVWRGKTMSTETVMSWELDNMSIGAAHSALSVREVVERHDGAFWFERERVSHQAWFRFLLPQTNAEVAEQAQAAHHSLAALSANDERPEFYDFDLFTTSQLAYELDERPLTELAYTVFDTETTGLNPGAGDEIIQIGAVRIVNGKLLRSEGYEQLIDPRRDIPAAGIPIHGITPDMVAGKPTVADVLPVFHTYAKDTVLVAHNAAFDMRFLQLKEGVLGLAFDQPVLDTLLLSAVISPNQESHRLEALAERFNITIHGRHTAMGDAMVTAAIFLRMIPLLAEMGIHTLGQARAAAEKTYFARIKY